VSDELIFLIVVGLRFGIPLLIFRFPLPAILACLVIDAADQTIFQNNTDLNLDGYQGYDKALDVYYLSIAYLSTFRNWTDPFAARVAQMLWYYRLVGVVAFELTQVRALLLVFPNTFEYFFIAYEVVRLGWNPARLSHRAVIGMAAFIWIFIKLPQEWWIHVAQLDFTDFMKEDVFGGPRRHVVGRGDRREPMVPRAARRLGHRRRPGRPLGSADGSAARLDDECRRRPAPGEHTCGHPASDRRHVRMGPGGEGGAGIVDRDHLRPGAAQHRRVAVAGHDRSDRTRRVERRGEPVARPTGSLLGDDGIAVRCDGARQRGTRGRVHPVPAPLRRSGGRGCTDLLRAPVDTDHHAVRPIPTDPSRRLRRRETRSVDSMSGLARLHWVGHATTSIDIDGFRVLTDPLLHRRVAHLRRRWPQPDPPAVDLLLISHAHIDHLHLRSLRSIGTEVPVVAPAGTGSLVRRAGFTRVIEVCEGDVVEVDRATVTATHARHPSGRGPHSRIDARPLGYLIDVAGHRTYFAGDTDLFDEMSELGAVDLALLPIWGWGPTIGVGHLDPERAVEAVDRIRPRVVVPIHWGTYAPENLRSVQPTWLGAPATEFARRMEGVVASRAVVLQPGDAIDLDIPLPRDGSSSSVEIRGASRISRAGNGSASSPAPPPRVCRS
jgi:L-ascorbate metabolism protein UlaG (beta-lactamase superfamily)